MSIYQVHSLHIRIHRIHEYKYKCITQANFTQAILHTGLVAFFFLRQHDQPIDVLTSTLFIYKILQTEGNNIGTLGCYLDNHNIPEKNYLNNWYKLMNYFTSL